jgi:hypothetical protein
MSLVRYTYAGNSLRQWGKGLNGGELGDLGRSPPIRLALSQTKNWAS